MRLLCEPCVISCANASVFTQPVMVLRWTITLKFVILISFFSLLHFSFSCFPFYQYCPKQHQNCNKKMFSSVLREGMTVIIIQQVSKILCDHSFSKEKKALTAFLPLPVWVWRAVWLSHEGEEGLPTQACVTEKGCLKKNPKLPTLFQEMTLSCWNLQ